MTQSVTQAPRSPSAIELQQIQFTWASDREPTLAIDALHIAHGEHVFLQGPSGCGKSTLLSLLTGIQTPQQGEVTLLGTRLSSLSAAKRDRFRAEHIGYIYQQFNLIPYLSLIDNVLLPCRFAPERAARCTQHNQAQDGRDQAGELLTTLGLDQSLWHKAAHQLSIGQQQRVAAARALIGSPEIIIADEPTSALDHDHRQRFINLLLSHTRKQQTTVLFVSHDPTLADFFDRTLSLPHINQQGAR